MKPWWFVLLVACSDKREHREPATFERDDTRRSIDVTVAVAGIAIRGVELVPVGRTLGTLELGYRIEARDAQLRVPARIMCRVGEHNVVYPASAEGKVPGPRLTSVFRPDPFSELPRACEVAFMTEGRRIASACYRDGELRDGACAGGTFPPPARTTQFSIELVRPALELHDGSAVISALFVLVEAVPAERRLAGQIRCEDREGVASGEGDLAFVPVEQMPAGAAVYGPLAIFLDRTPARDATCELRLVSRPTSGAPVERIHARYCLSTGAVRAGSC